MPTKLTRTIDTPTVMRFRGANKYASKTVIPPDVAVDLLNVVINESGNLTALRVPLAIASVGQAGACYGYYDYQRADGLRQLIAVFGTKIYKYEWVGGVLTPTQVDDNVDNAARWSMVMSNQVLYMANGKRMIKWDGTSVTRWGVAAMISGNLADVSIAAKAEDTMTFSRAGTLVTIITSGMGLMFFGSLAVTGVAAVMTGDTVAVTGVNAAVNIGAAVVTYAGYVGGNRVVQYNTVASGFIASTGCAGGKVTVAGSLTFSVGTGRKYGWSLKSSVSGHSGGVTLPSTNAALGAGLAPTACTSTAIVAMLADPQLDTVVWWATVDGGVTLYYHSEALITDRTQVQLMNDRLADNQLNKAIPAPYYNYPPPIGRYLAEWGGRIYIANVDGGKADIVYSGYEQIQFGRPEESFPPGNRLRLAIGADELRGIGVIQAGIVAFSKSNEMFMFRGEPEDVTGVDFVAYSAILEKLPWQTALLSHWTIESTPEGLHWLSSARTVDRYLGSGQPVSLSLAVAPVLRDLTDGAEEAGVACFFNYLDRDWYMLAVADKGNVTPSKIVVMDLVDGDDNSGVFIFDIGPFEYIDVIEDNVSGRPRVIVAQGGMLKEVNIIDSTVNAYHTSPTSSNNPSLGGYWKGGYFGNDNPGAMKMARNLTVEADTEGWTVDVEIVDGVGKTVSKPLVLAGLKPGAGGDGRKVTINRKFRRLSVQVNMPGTDQDISIVQMGLQVIPTSVR